MEVRQRTSPTLQVVRASLFACHTERTFYSERESFQAAAAEGDIRRRSQTANKTPHFARGAYASSEALYIHI